MFRISLVLGFITTFAFVNFAIASENLQRYDRVIAAYEFEEAGRSDLGFDIGPRRILGYLSRGAFFSDESKFGNKSLAFERSGIFQASENSFLSIFNEFSIAFWIKTPVQDCDILIGLLAKDGLETKGVTSVRIESEGYSYETGIIDAGGISARHSDGKNTHRIEVTDIKDVNMMDNTWHHIVFTLDKIQYVITIDGEIIFSELPDQWTKFTEPNWKGEEEVPTYIGYVGNETVISIELSPDNKKINGQIFFDDIVFYEEAFSATDIQELYKNGLKNFLEVMPVEPQKKAATTWAEVKSGR